MCKFTKHPSQEKLCRETDENRTNNMVDEMIEDGLAFEIRTHPLCIPAGYWGIVIEIGSKLHYYYVSEEIKKWHLYFFGPQLFIIAH